MSFKLNSDKPVYLQIMEQIERDILSGKYKPGDKFPSVRELAAHAMVNPNTMQKALTELERNGLVYSQRTSGRFITDNKELLETMKRDIAKKEIQDFIAHMRTLGFTNQEIQALIAEETTKHSIRKDEIYESI